MKLNINFLQTGGVPLTADLMADIMSAVQLYDVLGPLAGHLTIISGCEITGNYVSSGIVAIGNEVLYFEGGGIVPTVYIHTEEIQKTFENQTDKVLILKKTVKFGSGATNYNWTDFVKLKTLREIQSKAEKSATQNDMNSLVERVKVLEMKTAPIINQGIVMIWRKPLSEIPAGWKECTDFRGKTIFGRDPNDPLFENLGSSLGAASKKILRKHLPKEGIEIYPSKSTSTTWKMGSGSGQPLIDVHSHPMGDQYQSTMDRRTAPMGNGEDFSVLNPGRIVEFIEPNLP